jgi:hypothetical protein
MTVHPALPSWSIASSPVVAALMSVTLALHGWMLGWSAPISEGSGPAFFEFHLLAVGVLMLFVTWLSVPLWLLCLAFRRLRLTSRDYLNQALVFAGGWILILVAGLLIEASPASLAF